MSESLRILIHENNPTNAKFVHFELQEVKILFIDLKKQINEFCALAQLPKRDPIDLNDPMRRNIHE